MTTQSELREQTMSAVKQSTQPYIADRTKLGILILSIFLGSMITWSVFAPLSTGAVVSGKVEVDGQTLALQHLEGGIVKQIYFGNGASLKEDDILVEMSDISAQADKRHAATQMLTLQALRHRLLAERNKSPDLEFPDFEYPSISRAAIDEILDLEKDNFISRRAVFNKETEALVGQINSTKKILINGRAQLARVAEQLSLIIKEITDTSGLFDKGYATQSRVLALKRQKETYEGEKFRLMSQISNAETQIDNAIVSHKKYGADFYGKINAQLQELNTSYQQVTGLLAIANDKLERTKVRAPHAGVVMNMQVHKAGDILASGATVASLVPNNTHLVISARLNPADSASIEKGLPARITILAFNSRTAPTLEGIVSYVSPDVVIDKQTGLSYYPVQIQLLDKTFAELGNETLRPGMPAQVVITTAERPIIGYLLDPLMQTVRNAMHEK